jgi:hypothetical protein
MLSSNIMQNNYSKQLISPILHYCFTNSLQNKCNGCSGTCEVIYTYMGILTTFQGSKLTPITLYVYIWNSMSH